MPPNPLAAVREGRRLTPLGQFREALEADGFRIDERGRVDGRGSLSAWFDLAAQSYVRRALLEGRLDACDLLGLPREMRAVRDAEAAEKET